MQEEDSVDRLWLVIRSLKSPEGKYVLRISNNCRTIKSKSLMLSNLGESNSELKILYAKNNQQPQKNCTSRN